MLDPRVLFRLLFPRQHHIRICLIGQDLAAAMGAKTCQVFLSKDTLMKQLDKHPDIRTRHYAWLPEIIRDGMVIQEHRRRDRLSICYEHPSDPGKRFRTVIKSTVNGAEVYVSSFHRTKPGQTRALLGRGRMLRAHKQLI